MKKTSVALLSVMVFCIVLLCAVHAQNNLSEISNNIDSQDYETWGGEVRSHLYENSDNTMTRVECSNDRSVVIENYSLAGELLSKKSINSELEWFGGFLKGNEFNYLVFGQRNESESDSVEVIRVVKYDRNWKRLGAASVYGADTTWPFKSGSLRMLEAGKTLYIRTCHQMYRSNDGLRHQSNMTVVVDTTTMTASALLHSGYVSHSFNQFLVQSGTDLITADHGDAYPRGIVLCRFVNALSDGTIHEGASANKKVVFSINGETGNNNTGTSLGGMEMSSSTILLAGNSVDHKNNADLHSKRNIFLLAVDKNNMEEVKTKWYTSYPSDGNSYVSTPHLVKINDNEFLLMWTENQKTTKIRKIDGKGNVLASQDVNERILSDCKPQMIAGRLRWYVTKNSEPFFYSLDPSNLASLTKKSGADDTSGFCGANGENVKWELTGTGDDLLLTISGSGAMEDIEDAGNDAFFNLLCKRDRNVFGLVEEYGTRNGKVTRIKVEEGVTSLGNGCFENMTNVKEVSLPSTLTSIGDWAFRGLDKVKHIKIPNKVTSLGVGVFKGCTAMEELVVPDSVTVIGDRAFQDCTNLKSVSLSKNLKRLYNWTFSGCKSLRTLEIPNGVTILGVEVTNEKSPTNNNPYMNGMGVFENCSSLESVTIPASMEKIYEYAFYRCPALKDVYYGGFESAWKNVEVRSIGNYETVMQARMHYYSGNGKIYRSTDYQGETDLVIPEGVTRIDDYALVGKSNLQSVTFPSTLSYIGYYAFQNCTGITAITIPGSVKFVNRGAFNGCTGLREVKFSSGVNRIGTDSEGTFSGQVKPSGFGTFEGCTSLKTVYVPRSVTSIGEYSFYTCPALTDVYYEGNQEEWKKIPIVNGSNQPIIRANIHYNSYDASAREANCPSAKFVDVDPGAWYHTYVDFAVASGIMAGTSSNRFSPNAEVTRATLVQVLYALENKPEVAVTKKFSDVGTDQWYSAAVSWASANGVVGGYPDGTFRPNRSISRQDMAVMLFAYAKYKDMDTLTSSSVDAFKDKGKISNYAMPAMKWAVGKKYMNGMGDGTLSPLGTTTRAQLATVMKAMMS